MKVFMFMSLLVVGVDLAKLCSKEANAPCKEAKMSFNDMFLSDNFCNLYPRYRPCLKRTRETCAGYFVYFYHHRCPVHVTTSHSESDYHRNEVTLINQLIIASLITLCKHI
ncbi:uncharacterized protein LOC128249910 [Octopus bimaculoides]|uniref:uncharacterized protein LOC128249910 n=1 Tax=Octopus bimaculoides TaxID=37653 RepID=UPI0022E0157F|nr:uncharacterized protein LOC128249910 [Octopus bimaculoides]